MFSSKIKFVLLVYPLIFLSVNGYKWKKEEISNPMNGPPPHCNLENSGSPFCDPDSLLKKNDIDKIIQKQERISSLGSCVCDSKCPKNEPGLVVGILILKEFDDSSYKKSPGTIENPLQETADYVHKAWNLGTCGNSILIACAVQERSFALSVGEQAYKLLNKTWINGIFEENFRGVNSKAFNPIEKINHVLYMYEEAIKEELKSNSALAHSITSVEQSSTNLTFYITTILTILVFTITILFCVVAALNIFKQRKENDDVSIKDVWTRKFWLKAGNQYKAAKQAEVPEQDLEKNEPVKSNLASTEDLKDSVENINETTKPKLSKV